MKWSSYVNWNPYTRDYCGSTTQYDRRKLSSAAANSAALWLGYMLRRGDPIEYRSRAPWARSGAGAHCVAGRHRRGAGMTIRTRAFVYGALVMLPIAALLQLLTLLGIGAAWP